MAQVILFEALLRGATVGILLLSAVLFIRGGKGFRVERLGGLFLIATAAYTVISSPGLGAQLGFLRIHFIALATLNTVFFWWFATALFDDEFQWRWWRFVPFALIAGLFIARIVWPELARGPADNVFQQAIVIPIMLHVLWLAIAHRRDDLIERRRAFRLVFAALAGVFGLIIAISELIIGGGQPPQSLVTLHAGALLALTFGLTLWVLPPLTFLESAPARSKTTSPKPAPQDRADLDRLTHLMNEGVYRQEGLTIGALAQQMSLPEHRLRRLINGALGFRNFNAFLNEHRLTEAQAILSDPAQARMQITQIALDLGYGSVGPFNRAFKAKTGQTPTEFRKAALSVSPSTSA